MLLRFIDTGSKMYSMIFIRVQIAEESKERDFTGTPYIPIFVMLPVCYRLCSLSKLFSIYLTFPGHLVEPLDL